MAMAQGEAKARERAVTRALDNIWRFCHLDCGKLRCPECRDVKAYIRKELRRLAQAK